jgi:hypothetical protein
VSAPVDVLAPGETVDVIDLLAVCREFAVANSRGGDVFRLDVVSAAVAELIEAATMASATLGHIYHTVPLSKTVGQEAHADYQRLNAALARIGGAG